LAAANGVRQDPIETFVWGSAGCALAAVPLVCATSHGVTFLYFSFAGVMVLVYTAFV